MISPRKMYLKIIPIYLLNNSIYILLDSISFISLIELFYVLVI